MAQMGRIGGPLLADNLLRNGNNLAFDTNLLFFNVNSKTIGINNPGPSAALHVSTSGNIGQTTSGTINTINLIGTTQTEVGTLYITTNTIQNISGGITIAPAGSGSGTTIIPGLSTSNLYLYTNTVSNTVTNDSINISPNGSGQVNFANGNGFVQVTVNANLHAEGNITFDGNITLGSNSGDTINILAEVDSNIIPNTNDAYTLGSSSLTWSNVYSNTLTATTGNIPTIDSTTFNGGNVSFNTNSITNNITSDDITFSTSGTGVIKFNGFNYVVGSDLQFPVGVNGVISLETTGEGYVNFSGTNGVVWPSGSTSTRPASPVTGQIRYSSTLGNSEVWNGTQWIGVGGIQAVLTPTQVNDNMWAWDLILG
jgi:hypothetical protein